MQIFATLLTFLLWGIADLFYKIGNQGDGNRNHLKTGIMVGLVMGLHATYLLFVTHTNIDIMDIIKYLPVSFCYIASMVIGYRGLKYLELSISSPIQNTSGVIVALLFIFFFNEHYDYPFYIALASIFIGVITIAIINLEKSKKERKEFNKKNTFQKILTLTILFPLGYCLLDGLGTFLDGIYLDKLELIGEQASLIAYEYTFALYGLITFIYLKIKKEDFSIIKEKTKLIAAIFETGGEIFYVTAMSGNSTIAAPIIGSYCVLSMLLSRIFLKEKLSIKEYIGIFLVIVGVIILAFLDV
ncbi:MAG: EamA family transporter [Bacilli bacterium]|nr:EamA family transporter [Bacilli bacterium]